LFTRFRITVSFAALISVKLLTVGAVLPLITLK